MKPSRIVLVESESGTDQRKIWPLGDGVRLTGGQRSTWKDQDTTAGGSTAVSARKDTDLKGELPSPDDSGCRCPDGAPIRCKQLHGT